MTNRPKKPTLSAFDTGKVLDAQKIKQLDDERASAIQTKFIGANCSLRDDNGKVIGAVKSTAPIRILAYGGARKAGDNKGFKGAAENVLADYVVNEADNLCCYSIMLTGGITQLVKYIENQPKNSIQSLDIFTHGAVDSLHTVIGANFDTNKDDSVKRSIIYQNNAQQTSNYLDNLSTRDISDQYDIGDLDLDRFTESCKIEIHGCSTAGKKIILLVHYP